MTTITFDLPPQLEAWVKAQVESGYYIDGAEYLRDLIRQDLRGCGRWIAPSTSERGN